jgi:DNA-binding transcriptional ArsR family regulator
MIRIHFTSDDLVRIRIASTPDPMWETVLSLHMLQAGSGVLAFRQWRDSVRRRLPRTMRPLIQLTPSYGYTPDFLTPSAGSESLESGLDALLSTRRSQLHRDLEQFAAKRPPPTWTRALADGNVKCLQHLAAAIREYHETAITPYWTQVHAAIDAERAAQTRIMARLGIEGLLDSLHPDLRWRPPVLEVHGFTVTRDVHLDGQGLSVIPSFFCWQHPTLLRDPGLQPVLVYPVEDRLGPLDTSRADGSSRTLRAPLTTLLGPTRAAILLAIGEGCTTTELARRVGVSLPTASQHASVLRDAGLISTRRMGGSVLHTLRPLGVEVLATA